MATTLQKNLHLTQGTVSITNRGPFELESGKMLTDASLRYAIYGEPNEECSNVTLVCHALSGSSRVDHWWTEILDKIFDLDRECVVCFNVIGSCYGSTSPASLDPATGKPYGANFPQVTVRDWVRSQKIALEELGISHVRTAIGPSIGGMQALQWAVEYPGFVDRIVAMGAMPVNAMGLGLNHIQREAIRTDPEWRGGDYYGGPGPRAGLAQARKLAMITYKSPELFQTRHGRKADRKGKAPWVEECGRFDIAGYLEYQGTLFLDRFDANAYLSIIRAMDLFDPERDWPGETWERVRAKVLLFGISSDLLFPEHEVREFAEKLREAGVDCEYEQIVSAHGHDSFLAEPDKLIDSLKRFLDYTAAPKFFCADGVGAQSGELA
ncbi:MAG: homoserine O-acetyltransferase [Acidobacteria bacterium]|nr:MAG: homoserine O-acetyltransferase [Acidobacteriota bacterium]